IGRAAHEPRDVLRQNVQRLARSLAAGDTLRVRGKHRQIAIPARRELAPLHPLDLNRELRILRPVRLEKLVPLSPRALAAGSDAVLEVLIHTRWHQELRVLWPPVGTLGKPNLLVAQRLAVGLGPVLLMRRTVADMTVQNYQGGAASVLPERLERMLDAAGIIRVADSQNAPAVGGKAKRHILGKGDVRAAFDRDPVVVVDPAEIVETEMAGERRRLRADAFHQAAVAAD